MHSVQITIHKTVMLYTVTQSEGISAEAIYRPYM